VNRCEDANSASRNLCVLRGACVFKSRREQFCVCNLYKYYRKVNSLRSAPERKLRTSLTLACISSILFAALHLLELLYWGGHVEHLNRNRRKMRRNLRHRCEIFGIEAKSKEIGEFIYQVGAQHLRCSYNKSQRCHALHDSIPKVLLLEPHMAPSLRSDILVGRFDSQ
jgi:hypothetical protein